MSDYQQQINQYNFPEHLNVTLSGKCIQFKLPVLIPQKIKSDLFNQDFFKDSSIVISQKPKANKIYVIKGGKFENKIKSLLFILKNLIYNDEPIFEAEYIQPSTDISQTSNHDLLFLGNNKSNILIKDEIDSVKEFDFIFGIEKLKDIPFEMYEKDFIFHYRGKNYTTSRFIADLLSPTVRQLHYCDKTSKEFYIEEEDFDDQKRVEDKEEEEKYFSEFLNLYAFENSKIDYIRFYYYGKFFYLLGNVDEYLQLESEYFKSINEQNAIEMLIKFNKIFKRGFEYSNSKGDGFIEKVVKFVSIHFENIDKEKIKLLNKDIIESILSSTELRVKDEDSLLDFVIELYSNDAKYSYLFEYILFNNVSKEKIEEFIDTFSIDDLNVGIWRSICQRLVGNEELNIERYSKNAKIENISGIMQHLTTETGGNIHDNGTIEITSNSIYSIHHPKNLVDFQKDNYYQSENKEFVFVCFDFKDKSVNLMSYTIKSNGNSTGTYNLKSWVVEVSNDGNKWDEIDRHENDSALNGSKILKTFKVQKQNHGFYRFIRIRQTSPGWNSSNNIIWFFTLDFNGELKCK